MIDTITSLPAGGASREPDSPQPRQVAEVPLVAPANDRIAPDLRMAASTLWRDPRRTALAATARTEDVEAFQAALGLESVQEPQQSFVMAGPTHILHRDVGNSGAGMPATPEVVASPRHMRPAAFDRTPGGDVSARPTSVADGGGAQTALVAQVAYVTQSAVTTELRVSVQEAPQAKSMLPPASAVPAPRAWPEQPVVDPAQPVMTPAQPIVEHAQTVVGREQQVAVGAQPAVTQAQPVVAQAQPEVPQAQLPMTQAQPAVAYAQPVLAPTQTVVAQAQPVMTLAQPIAEHAQTVVGREQQVVVGAQPAVTQAQPVVAQARPEVAQAQLPMTQAQPVMTLVQPIVEHAQAVVGQEQQVVVGAQPVVAHVKPAVVQAQPVVAQAQPLATQLQPIFAPVQPVVFQEQQVQAEVRPVLMQAQPDLAQVQPVVAQAQPVVPTPQPAVEQAAPTSVLSPLLPGAQSKAEKPETLDVPQASALQVQSALAPRVLATGFGQGKETSHFGRKDEESRTQPLVSPDSLAVLPADSIAPAVQRPAAEGSPLQVGLIPLAPQQARDAEFTVRQVLKTLAVRDLEALETGRPLWVRLDGVGLPSAVLEVRLDDQQLLMTVNSDDDRLVRWLNNSQEQLNASLKDSAPGARTVEVKAQRTDSGLAPDLALRAETERLSAPSIAQGSATPVSWSASWLQSPEASRPEAAATGSQGDGRGGAAQGDPSQGQREGRESARQEGWAAVDRDTRLHSPAMGHDRAAFQQALWSSVSGDATGAGGR